MLYLLCCLTSLLYNFRHRWVNRHAEGASYRDAAAARFGAAAEISGRRVGAAMPRSEDHANRCRYCHAEGHRHSKKGHYYHTEIARCTRCCCRCHQGVYVGADAPGAAPTASPERGREGVKEEEGWGREIEEVKDTRMEAAIVTDMGGTTLDGVSIQSCTATKTFAKNIFTASFIKTISDDFH